MNLEIFPLIGISFISFGTGLSIIIATYYYNKDYYLKTKIEYLKILKKNKK